MISVTSMPLHFSSYKPCKLRGTRLKGRNSAVQSSQLSWAGQYKKCVYSTISSLLQSIVMHVVFNKNLTKVS